MDSEKKIILYLYIGLGIGLIMLSIGIFCSYEPQKSDPLQPFLDNNIEPRITPADPGYCVLCLYAPDQRQCVDPNQVKKFASNTS
jgi:hypothetical protein